MPRAPFFHAERRLDVGPSASQFRSIVQAYKTGVDAQPNTQPELLDRQPLVCVTMPQSAGRP
jgi:hypothetical protein